MSDNQSRESDERKASHKGEHQSSAPEQMHASEEGKLDYSPQLLNATALGARGNSPVRAVVMERAQKTHGNQAVQRFLSAQRSAVAAAEAGTDDEIARRIESKAGNGGQLDKSIQSKLEAGLGADMSGVRVHTDHEADHLARSVQSVAFTSGQDIFFRAGAFDPNSAEGLKLLAHEATHTVQQAQGPVDGTPSEGGVSISDPSDSFEQAAERAADTVVSGGKSADSAEGDRRVQRLEEGLFSPAQRSVQRSFMGDYWDNMWGHDPAQFGEKPRGHAYAHTNAQGGADAGFSAIAGSGNIGGVPFAPDILSASGHAGAWDAGDGNTRYGIQGQADVAHMDINKGGLVSGDIGAFDANAEASWGDNGATLGAGANVVDGSITLGKPTAASNTDESLRLGLSYGVGAAGRLHWGDSDHDGNREYGFGFDAGPFSMDLKTEDPLRTLGHAAMGPFGDYLMPGGNLTNQAGEYASQGWDAAKGAASSAYDTAADYGGRAYNAASSGLSSAYDTAADYGNRAYNTAADYGNRAYNTVSDGASEAWDAAKDYGSRAVNTAADYGNRAYNTAADYGNRAVEGASQVLNTAEDYGSRAINSVSDYGSRALNTASDLGNSAYDTASSAVSTVGGGLKDAANWLTDW